MIDSKINTLLILLSAGSYTKAAQELNLTQPAVTHHIKQLEAEFDIKIFYKDRKELKLTPEGTVLVKYGRRALAVYNSAVIAIEDSRKKIKHFVIAITPSASENLLPQVIATYCNLHPHIHINILMDTINNIYTLLKNYEADIAIVEGRIEHPDLTSVLLDTDYLCLAVSPKHHFANRSCVTLAELKQEKFILRSINAGTRRLFETYLTNHSENIRNFNVIVEIDNVSTIKELVAQNLGITIIAHSACRDDQAAGKLCIIPVENSSMVREINMVHQKSFSHVQILEELRAIYRSIHTVSP